MPDEGWPDVVDVTPVTDADPPPSFHVAAPLWTSEEGRSDLTLYLRLTQTSAREFDVEVDDLHVLRWRASRPRGHAVLRRHHAASGAGAPTTAMYAHGGPEPKGRDFLSRGTRVICGTPYGVGDPGRFAAELVGVGLHGPFEEAEAASLVGLEHADPRVRRAAVTALGHAARVHTVGSPRTCSPLWSAC